MTASPSILIAMPVFEGWDHVGQTIASVKAQTHENYRVLISVDGDDRRSFEACAEHANDSRFELVLQPRRLHWDGNVNWLASHLREDYFCYWQHDDYCHPEYLAKLAAYAEFHPEASSVYCDMRFFGQDERLLEYPSVKGFALERVLKQAAINNPAPIRCLIRADAMRTALPVRLAVTWAMALASAGELHRVPEILYFRRLRPNSLGVRMLSRSPEELWAASLEWGLGLLQFAGPLVRSDEQDRLLTMIVDQLVFRGIRGRWQYDFRSTEPAERTRFVLEFLKAAKSRFGSRPFRNILENPEGERLLNERLATLSGAGAEALVIDALLANSADFTGSP